MACRPRPAPLADDEVVGSWSADAGLRVKNTFLEAPSGMTPTASDSRSGLSTAPAWLHPGSIQISLVQAMQTPSVQKLGRPAFYEYQEATPSTVAPTPSPRPAGVFWLPASPDQIFGTLRVPPLPRGPSAPVQMALATSPPTAMPAQGLSSSRRLQVVVSPQLLSSSPPAQPLLSSSPSPSAQLTGSPAVVRGYVLDASAGRGPPPPPLSWPNLASPAAKPCASGGPGDLERARWADIEDDDQQQEESRAMLRHHAKSTASQQAASQQAASRRGLAPPPPLESPKLPPGFLGQSEAAQVPFFRRPQQETLPIFPCVANPPEPKFAPPARPAPPLRFAIPPAPAQAPRFSSGFSMLQQQRQQQQQQQQW
ncbi:unnamed protein product [Polarella glacialis]|uniref:Uncharacterized protein n=1 Tax=Polarella glacialis TaxID=89957 RepID=A0A813JCP6_POLGL|nr:unnamed protein product [Polarella glacialis]